jgi:hypothetical protein
MPQAGAADACKPGAERLTGKLMASALAATPDDKKSKAAVRATVATEGAAPESPAGAPAGMPIFLEAGFVNPVAQSPAAGSESGGASRQVTADTQAAADSSAPARGLVLVGASAAQSGERGGIRSKAPAAEKAGPAVRMASGVQPIGAQGGSKGTAAQAAPADGRGVVGKAPTSPHEDPGFQAVVARVRAVAEQQGHNNPAQLKAAQAQAAASGPVNDVASQAAAAQVGKMGAQEPNPFDKNAFKAALWKKISEVAPTNLEEADDFKESGKVGEIKGALTSQVAASKDVAQGPIQRTSTEAPNPAGLQPKPVTPLPPNNIGAPPPAVGAADAAPKPKSDAEISLDASSRSLDQQMTDGRITPEQLSKSNEPQFKGALKDKQEAQAQAQTGPAAYRKTEQTLLGAAKTEAAGTTAPQLLAMHGVRGGAFNKIGLHQLATKSADEQARAQVAQHVEEIYQGTKAKVEARLKQLDDQTNQTFDQGAEQARATFENYVDLRFSDWKYDRYTNRIGGSVLWAKDKLFGLPDDVDQFYKDGRDLYLKRMDGVIDQVAAMVETGLTETKGLITAGWEEVQTYVKGLPTSLRQVGEEAANKIQDSFDGLRQSVNDKRDELIEGLANKYVESLKQVDARIDQMKEENKGLVNKAVDAIAGVIDTILKLKDMLLGILSRAAAAIELIIEDPIGFLGNLVSGVKLGLQNFIGNIGAHMKQGFLDWLFGAVAEAGIQLPKTFDLEGILGLVMQVLGLTWAAIRARAVTILGEKVVSAIETTVDFIRRVITEGPGALWEWMKEKVGDIKAMVLDQLEDFVVTRVIMAGITWVVGLLNPASAFIKACKAIYDIIMFFVERGSQIIALVNAVIDSITAIASGAIGGAAAMVEDALAKGIPVVIGFLASLLGLGGISDKIKSVIEAIRKPIGEAIDWVIHKAVSLLKAGGKFVAGLFGGKDAKPTGTKAEGPVDSQNVKHEVAQDVAGKTLATFDEEQDLINTLYAKYQPFGLKSVRFVPSGDGLAVIVEASAAEEVAKLNLLKSADQNKLITFMRRFRYNAKTTYIYTYYRGRRIDQVRNYPSHAELYFLNKSIPMVKECLLQDLRAGQIQPNSAVDISLEMTRTPCEGCAVRIPEGIRLLKSDPSLKDLNIRMIVNASTITLGSGETGLKNLLSHENVQVKASDIWSVILAKLEEYPSFYDEVKQEHYTRPELNEFKTRAVELQGEIDAIVDSKKAGPRPLSRGR